MVGRLRGEPVKPFRYQDRGDVAVIGRLRGVTNIGWLGPFGRQGGFVAWALWLGIHIVYLIGFANRIVVSVRWAWSFLTRGRSTRLITGSPQVLPIERPGPPARFPVAGGTPFRARVPRSRGRYPVSPPNYPVPRTATLFRGRYLVPRRYPVRSQPGASIPPNMPRQNRNVAPNSGARYVVSRIPGREYKGAISALEPIPNPFAGG